VRQAKLAITSGNLFSNGKASPPRKRTRDDTSLYDRLAIASRTESWAVRVTEAAKRRQGVCQPLGGDNHP